MWVRVQYSDVRHPQTAILSTYRYGTDKLSTSNFVGKVKSADVMIIFGSFIQTRARRARSGAHHLALLDGLDREHFSVC